MKGKMKGYKTVAFNAVMSFVMLLSVWKPDTASSLPGATEVSGLLDQAEMWIVAVWGIGSVMLRAVTSTSIFKSE